MEPQRTLEMLHEIETDERVSQRALSSRLGISLGLANVYLKRLAKKGYIKITTVPGSRLLRYALTPQGFAAKTRLTYEFAKYSYQFMRDARRNMRLEFEELALGGARRVVICGTEELSEIAYLAMAETGLELAGVVRSKELADAQEHVHPRAKAKFLGCAVSPVNALPTMQFDAVVVFSAEDYDLIKPFIDDGKKIILLSSGPQ
jgi:DNA-binding MarR family transcriptional regulator